MVITLNIAICDDEKKIREQIKELVQNRLPDVSIDMFETGKALFTSVKYFDLIFLDIQLEGMNGIETARLLRERSEQEKQKESVLIFITGMKEYVFEAFDVSAFHFLLKPIEKDKFTKVLERALKEIKKAADRRQEHLFLKTRDRHITIEKHKIIYIESRKRKVEIHTAEDMIEIYATMNKLEEQLGTDFYRCHRGYLINMAYITEYSVSSISLSNGETVILAKEKYNEFVKKYMRYLRNGGTVCV